MRLLGLTDTLLYWVFFSHYGVFIFFVISGFVISRSTSRLGSAANYFSFLVRRCLRIYPAFLISLLFAIAVARYFGRLPDIDMRTVLANLIFLNGLFALNIPGYNNVTWSLFFEFVFYLTFPLARLVASRLPFARKGMAIFIWGLFVGALAVIGFKEWFMFVAFLFGIAAGLQSDASLRALAKMFKDRDLLIAYLAATTLGACVTSLPRIVDGEFIWGASYPTFVTLLSAIVTLIAVRAAYSQGFFHRFLSCRIMVQLGEISFSFFLVHVAVIGIVFPLMMPYTEDDLPSALAIGAVAFISTILAATVLYFVAERPYYTFVARHQR